MQFDPFICIIKTYFLANGYSRIGRIRSLQMFTIIEWTENAPKPIENTTRLWHIDGRILSFFSQKYWKVIVFEIFFHVFTPFEQSLLGRSNGNELAVIKIETSS